MVLERAGAGRLAARERERPQPGPGEILLRVTACGVCRTDLHVVDGELPEPRIPLVPGHEVVGRVAALGEGVARFALGERVGVPWLGATCGTCRYCAEERENLCEHARFTGYDLDGGFAEYAVADARFAVALGAEGDDVATAPLLCAGLIGYRSYRIALAGPTEVRRLGLYGFGVAAHLLCQVAVHEGREVYAFTRPGDDETRAFARGLGAVWAGSSEELPPGPLDAAIVFAPVGALVPVALGAVRPGGAVVCAGIHMSDIPRFPYRLLWQERVLRSVANLTRRDAEEFLALAPRVPVRPTAVTYALAEANRALDDFRRSRIRGAAVLVP